MNNSELGRVAIPAELLRQLRHYTDCYLSQHPNCGAPTPQEIDAQVSGAIDLGDREVLVDGVGVSIEAGEPFSFTCCDCGLTHRCVIVTKGGGAVGFAVERDQTATATIRGAHDAKDRDRSN